MTYTYVLAGLAHFTYSASIVEIERPKGHWSEKEPIYDVYCTSRRQYQRFLNILFWDVSVAQLVAPMSGVVLGGVVKVMGSNLARGKIFTASIGSVDSLYPSVYIYKNTPQNN